MAFFLVNLVEVTLRLGCFGRDGGPHLEIFLSLPIQMYVTYTQ